MNVNVIACVSGNYSHLNWKWSNNSVPFDKQMAMSRHTHWKLKSQGQKLVLAITCWEHMCVHTHAYPRPGLCFLPPRFLQGCCFWLQDCACHFPSLISPSPLAPCFCFCAWAAGQCHRDRSVVPLTAADTLKCNLGWSGHLGAGWTRGLIAP